MEDRLYTLYLGELVAASVIGRDDKILVVCGGPNDCKVLGALGFTDVTISNLDSRHSSDSFLPYKWEYQNVEELTCDDASYDWVIVHAGLHHCYSPHRGLVEMIRVARYGCLVFESRDSFIMRLAVRLGMVAEYELEAVHGNDLAYGGVQNTHIPNRVYRWTEAEVHDTVNTYLPQYSDNRIEYRYKLRYPFKRFKKHRSPMIRVAGMIAYIPVKLFGLVLPKQCNEFGFLIRKGKTLHPWLADVEGEIQVDKAYFERRFVG